MKIALSLRSATRDDVEDISSIHAACWREVYGFMPSAVLDNRNREFRKKQWNNWFSNKGDNENLTVAESDGQVVGFSFCLKSDDPDAENLGEMRAMYVLPDYRGGATGPLMMRNMACFLREQGLAPMVLWAFKQNPIRLWYAQLGWKRFLERDRFLAGHGIPEIGYQHTDPDAFISRLDRLIAAA